MRYTIVVFLERFDHKWSFQRVDLKELLLVHLEADGNGAAVVLAALQNILRHAAYDLFGQLCRVVMPVSNVAVNLLHIAECCMELVIGHGVSVQSRRSFRQGQRERNTARPQVHSFLFGKLQQNWR